MKKFLTPILSLACVWILYYMYLPTLNFNFLSGSLFFFIVGIVIVFNIMIYAGLDDIYFLEKRPWILILLIGIIIFVILFAMVISPLITVDIRKNQLGEPVERSFTEELSPIDLAQIPIVDEELARKLADKKLGEDATLGSQVDIGEFSIQNVNGELILVAPLVHSGFTKWISNSKGTPGYVRISASNPNDVRLVQEVDGKKIFIKYQREAYFGDDLKRKVRNSGFRTTGLTDYSFELDDFGNPFWVITTYQNTTFWSSSEATGVVVVNVNTGESTYYTVENSPEWIDCIQPMSFINDQINNAGKYVNGALNFSNNGKYKTTDGMSTVYNNGRCYYYTGLTSVGSDDSTIGFYLVDTRTKEVSKYNINGAHENAAMRSAEGNFQDYNYVATFPLPINVEGIPTYFMCLKDNEGLIKKYSFVNINSYNIVGDGDTRQDAKRNYLSEYLGNGNQIAISDKSFEYSEDAIISRISSRVDGGNTFYIIALNTNPNLFLASSSISDELTITEPGDSVHITYNKVDNGTISITAFDNLAFTQPISQMQLTQNELIQDGKNNSSEKTNVIPVDTDKINKELENMSEEEKAEMLKNNQKQ